jgi:hypothetical protein
MFTVMLMVMFILTGIAFTAESPGRRRANNAIEARQAGQ